MYVDAAIVGNQILVSERHPDGNRRVVKYQTPYDFFYQDDAGTYVGLDDSKLSKYVARSRKEMQQKVEELQAIGCLIYESDIRAEFKVLERNYRDQPIPTVNLALIDIEVDSVSSRGWARFSNAYAPINALTVHRRWLGDTWTFLLPPDGGDVATYQALVDDVPNTIVFATEAELLAAFLVMIEDADVFSGWNSDLFDLPYIIARIRIAFGGETCDAVAMSDDEMPAESVAKLQALGLFGTLPRRREVDNYGSVEIAYDISGRVHLDYLLLYRKLKLEEQHSYKLDYILELEVDDRKVAYEGSLEDLYRKDFRLFAIYNRGDVLGLVKLDKKLGFVDQAVGMCHMACVVLRQIFGSVTIIEQAITVEMHRQNRYVWDKPPPAALKKIPGAFVLDTRPGLKEWIASFDINSLYPNTIRLLNISPEKLLGQFDLTETEEFVAAEMAAAGYAVTDESKQAAEAFKDAWTKLTGTMEYHAIVDCPDPDKMLTLVMNDETRMTHSAADWRDLISNGEFALSANGTLFKLDSEGIIPFCLGKWFGMRKEMQKKMKEAAKAAKEETDSERADEFRRQADDYNRKQAIYKVFLNATYGAFLNRFFRFSDPRLGRSVTLSGRVITKHMCRRINEVLYDSYEFGDQFILSDTDSGYISLAPLVAGFGDDPFLNTTIPVVEAIRSEFTSSVVEIADAVAGLINSEFAARMSDFFFVPTKRGEVIRVNREVVARRGLFKDKKKRYALFVVDKEGTRTEPGAKKDDSLKIMGMDSERSDTPKFVQEFLEECLAQVIRDGMGMSALRTRVANFRKEFRARPPWTCGSPVRVSNLTAGTAKLDKYLEATEKTPKGHKELAERAAAESPNTYWAVKAAYWTNRYIAHFGDGVLDAIRDGDKIEIILLRPDPIMNPLRAPSLAVPVGARTLPQWFKEMPFDVGEAEKKMIDRKMENIFGGMGWDSKAARVRNPGIWA